MKKLTNESFKNGWKQALKGVTVEDILNMKSEDLLMLNKSNLSKVVSRVVSATNKRINAIEKADLTSKIIRENVGGKGVRLSVKGKDVTGLMMEWVASKKVLGSETTTVKGRKEELREIARERFSKQGVDISKFLTGGSKEKTFWKALDRLDELNVYIPRMTTNESVGLIREAFKGKYNEDDILTKLLAKVKEYETEKAEQVTRVTSSRFDDLGINN